MSEQLSYLTLMERRDQLEAHIRSLNEQCDAHRRQGELLGAELEVAVRQLTRLNHDLVGFWRE